MLPGEVIYVSADAMPNEKRVSDENVCITRIRLSREEAAHVEDFTPAPGMPVEVFMKISS